MQNINYITNTQVNCSKCNREFTISISDLKENPELPASYKLKCPKCSNNFVIKYKDLPNSFKDTL